MSVRPRLEEFVRARIEEDVVVARLSVSVEPASIPGGGSNGSDRASRVTNALDRWELLALADTADHDGRPDLATGIRRRLALDYVHHDDFDPAWLPAADVPL